MIEAMKQALDAFHQIFESTPVYHNDGTCIINDKSVELSNKAIASLRQAIAHFESQEPVAWMYDDDYQRMLTSETFCKVWSLEVGSAERGLTNIRLYTHPSQRTEQEPVQVSPLEFVEMVMEKEHLIGKPIFWAEWPNKEKNT